MAALAVGVSALPVARTAHAAGGYPDGATGYDIGWPQCAGNSPQAGSLPPGGAGVAIVEVNYGHPWDGPYANPANYAGNPCLSAEWAWAKTSPYPPHAYIIVNHPNSFNSGANRYDYGIKSAAAAVGYANAHNVHPAVWWLDVEVGLCWDAACDGNYDQVGAQLSIQGSLDYLHSIHLTVGIYSTAYQWNLITGGYVPPGGVPVWAADYDHSQAQAYLGCTASHAFAGGDVWLVQSAPNPFDEDYSCPAHHGYWLYAGDGGIFPFGTAGGFGSTGNIRLNKPMVGMEATASFGGYWVVAADGGIFPFGDAVQHSYGSTGGTRLNKPVVGMARTHTGNGYWLVASDGGIFPFGDAVQHSYGSTGGIRLNQPIVAMARTGTGNGYYLLASDGGIFPFGDAVNHSYGSTGGMTLNKPIVSMALTPTGNGYWLVAADGGIFPFGDALQRSYGSAGGTALDSAVVGMAATADGLGYWLVTARGSVLPFGDAVPQTYGSLASVPLNAPVLGIVAGA